MGETKIHGNSFCHVSLINVLICNFFSDIWKLLTNKYSKIMSSRANEEREFYPVTFTSCPRKSKLPHY